jgi:hypothetical protein
VLSTNQKGAIAETAILHEATKCGIVVYRPAVEGARADMIFEIGPSYLIPFSMFARRSNLYLRLSPAKNNQRRLVHWAEDYRLGAIAQLGERRSGTPKVVGSSPTSSTPKPPREAALF